VRDNPFLKHDLGIPVGVGGRHLPRDEAQAFIARLLAEPQDDRRDLLLLTLYLAGQRSAQLAAATITVEAETQAPCLLILDAKQRGDTPRPHVLPLQGPALDLLAGRGLLEDGAAIFGVDYVGGHALAKAAGKLCARLVKEWQAELAAEGKTFAHFSKGAIRSGASTGLAQLGVGDQMVDLLLSHGQKTVDWVHYNRWEYLPEKRKALAKWESWLSEPVPAPVLDANAGKVIPLRRAA